jgi:hypothetical protein
LRQAEEISTRSFRNAQAIYMAGKPLLTLVVALSIVLLLFTGFPALRRRIAGRRPVPAWAQPRFPTRLAAIGILVILFGYQSFKLAGAALAAVPVFLLLLAALPWPIDYRGSEEKQP